MNGDEAHGRAGNSLGDCGCIAMVKHFTPSRINRDDGCAMFARIEVRHEPAFDAGGQKGRGRTRLVIDGATPDAASCETGFPSREANEARR